MYTARPRCRTVAGGAVSFGRKTQGSLAQDLALAWPLAVRVCAAHPLALDHPPDRRPLPLHSERRVHGASGTPAALQADRRRCQHQGGTSRLAGGRSTSTGSRLVGRAPGHSAGRPRRAVRRRNDGSRVETLDELAPLFAVSFARG
eukprot:scaffold29537_cov56-Phaeocystis_antarctica.AAC.2